MKNTTMTLSEAYANGSFSVGSPAELKPKPTFAHIDGVDYNVSAIVEILIEIRSRTPTESSRLALSIACQLIRAQHCEIEKLKTDLRT